MVQHIKYEHTQFSLSEREKIYLDLKNPKGGILIQTCNRVELYQGQGYVQRPVVEHLFSLTAGLKSKLIGETSIQGQVKQAYLRAASKEKLSPALQKLFQSAIMVGKMVRNQTKISEGAMSHSQATVQIIENQVEDLAGLKIMVLGAHNMNGNILHYLQKKGAQNVLISNRKYIKAFQLAQAHQCKAFRFDKIQEHLQEADVVISATSAPHLIIKEEQVTANKKQLMVDLAVPRDIAPVLGSRPNIRLFNVEDIENRIGQNMNERLSEIEPAQQIIENEADKFMAWQTKRQQYNGSKKNKNTRAA